MRETKGTIQLETLLKRHRVSPEIRDFFLIETPEKGKKIDLQKVFGNKQPVVVEIGSGRGELIYQLSEINPEINYLGIELSSKRIVSMLKKFEPEVNPNIKLIKAKVDPDFLSVFPDKSLTKVIILHPDPWPKRRHHKNRLINEEFTDRLAAVIVDQGEVYISTDHSGYADAILNCFNSHNKFSPLYDNGFRRVPFWDNLPTYFEKKMNKAGYTPYYMRYVVSH